MKLPGEVYAKIRYGEDLKEGEHTAYCDFDGEEYTVKYVMSIDGEYVYALDYIISEPEIIFKIIKATIYDEDGNIIKLEI